MKRSDALSGHEIAIVGMSGRFPKADTVAAMWQKVENGECCIERFQQVDQPEFIGRKLIDDPNYIKAKGVLNHHDSFDFAFFGYKPMEAAILDPQIRHFHEIVVNALEDANCNYETYPGRIALYGAATPNPLWEATQLARGQDSFGSRVLFDKDYLTTLVSYRLNLRGPSLTVATGCSSSLVALHMACQSLLLGESDLALAGGISITLPNRDGYLIMDGMIMSPTGECRPFEEGSNGTVFSSGGAVVALKLLSQAIEDGSHIYGVIRGSAVNNDGQAKGGYSAPSYIMQRKLYEEALAVAGISAADIGYIETHGTGTELGDVIEMQALVDGYAGHQGIVIGAVKSNLGHLDVASGITGLIKATLCLQKGIIVPICNFRRVNRKIEQINKGFIFPTEKTIWRDKRIAGISSFGIGGTNAHVIVEHFENETVQSRPCSLFVPLSFRSPQPDTEEIREICATIENKAASLSDLALSLQSGRVSHVFRTGIHTDSKDELAALVRNLPLKRLQETSRKTATHLVLSHQDLALPGVLQARLMQQLEFNSAWVHGCQTPLAKAFLSRYLLLAFLDKFCAASQVHGFGLGEINGLVHAGLLSPEAAVDILNRAVHPDPVVFARDCMRALKPLEKTSKGFWSCTLQRTVESIQQLDLAYFIRIWQVADGTSYSPRELPAGRSSFLLLGGENSNLTAYDGDLQRSLSWSAVTALDEILSFIWLQGFEVKFADFYSMDFQKVPFPPTRFLKTPLPTDLQVPKSTETGKSSTTHLYRPSMVLKQRVHETWNAKGQTILLFSDQADKWAALKDRGYHVIRVMTGHEFASAGPDTFTFDPRQDTHFRYLAAALTARGCTFTQIITDLLRDKDLGAEDCRSRGLYFLTRLAATILPLTTAPVILNIVGCDILPLHDRGRINCDKALVQGFLVTLPQENQRVRTRLIEVGDGDLSTAVIDECLSTVDDTVVMHWQGRRWTQEFLPLRASQRKAAISLRTGGTYVISGGLGHIGSQFARYLAQAWKATVILFGQRSVTEVATRLQELTSTSGRIHYYAVDVSDEQAMIGALDECQMQHGNIHGVLHFAGFVQEASLKVIESVRSTDFSLHFGPKAAALKTWDAYFQDKDLDFICVASSISTILGGMKHCEYAAINSYLDAWVASRQTSKVRWRSIAWDLWQSAGHHADDRVTFEEARSIFERALASEEPVLYNSMTDLEKRLDVWVRMMQPFAEPQLKSTLTYRERPRLPVAYVAPVSTVQKDLTKLWSDFFQISDIGIHDNFFALGATSLNAIEMLRLMKGRGFSHITVGLFLENATIAALTEVKAGPVKVSPAPKGHLSRRRTLMEERTSQ